MMVTDNFLSLESFSDGKVKMPLAYVLQKAIEAHVLPVLPISSELHVFATCWMGLLTLHTDPKKSPLIKHSARKISSIHCVEVERGVCVELIDKGFSLVKTAEIVYVDSNAPEGLKKIEAKTLGKNLGSDYFSSASTQGRVPVIWPCFVIVQEPDRVAHPISSYNSLEDFQANPGVLVRIEDLRFLPADEKRLKQALAKPQRERVLVHATGVHLSAQLAQLVEVFQAHEKELHQARTAAVAPSRRQEICDRLHQALLSKDENAWTSLSLRKKAIQLIFPKPRPNERSKKSSPYDGNDMPTKLVALLNKLQRDYDKVSKFESKEEHVRWLSSDPLTRGTDVEALATIVRLAPPQRGGRRISRQPS